MPFRRTNGFEFKRCKTFAAAGRAADSAAPPPAPSEMMRETASFAIVSSSHRAPMSALESASLSDLLQGATRELSEGTSSNQTNVPFLKLFLRQACSRPPASLAQQAPARVIGAFYLALFERKWGAGEHLVLSTASANASSVSDPLAPVAADRLMPVVEALMKFVLLQRIGTPTVDAFAFVSTTTDKPYVRDQTFRFFFEWIRTRLEALPHIERRELLVPSLLADGESVPASTASDDFDSFDEPDDADSRASGMGDAELSASLLRMIETGLTDVWSAIRKICAKKLQGLIQLLCIENVRRVCVICAAFDILVSAPAMFAMRYSQHAVNYWFFRARQILELAASLIGVCDLAAETSSRKSSWQAKEGALLGLEAVLCAFEYQSANRHEVGPASPHHTLVSLPALSDRIGGGGFKVGKESNSDTADEEFPIPWKEDDVPLQFAGNELSELPDLLRSALAPVLFRLLAHSQLR